MVAWNKRIQLASKWSLLGYIRQEVLFEVPTTKHKNSLILKTLASVQTPHLASTPGDLDESSKGLKLSRCCVQQCFPGKSGQTALSNEPKASV